jgi:hypothetical protein
VPAPTVLVTAGIAASSAATVIFLRREPAAARRHPRGDRRRSRSGGTPTSSGSVQGRPIPALEERLVRGLSMTARMEDARRRSGRRKRGWCPCRAARTPSRHALAGDRRSGPAR